MRGAAPNDVLAEARHWDEATRRVVSRRVSGIPPIRFFTPAEATALGAFCDLVTDQQSQRPVPVLNMVDEKLFEGRLDGFRYDDMPDDRETWRRVPRGLDAAARQHGAPDFLHASTDVQCRIIEALAQGELHGEVWDELPPSNAWSVVMRAILSAFYSHPWAWNEIGFGGPAYPRGYARFGVGQRESWEGEAAFERDPVKDTHERGVEGAE